MFFLRELSGGQNQGTNISSESEIDSAYSEEENLMEDAAIVTNGADEELVKYFEYVEGITGTIYTDFGKVKHTIINKKCFYYYFIFLHSLY